MSIVSTPKVGATIYHRHNLDHLDDGTVIMTLRLDTPTLVLVKDLQGGPNNWYSHTHKCDWETAIIPMPVRIVATRREHLT